MRKKCGTQKNGRRKLIENSVRIKRTVKFWFFSSFEQFCDCYWKSLLFSIHIYFSRKNWFDSRKSIKDYIWQRQWYFHGFNTLYAIKFFSFVNHIGRVESSVQLEFGSDNWNSFNQPPYTKTKTMMFNGIMMKIMMLAQHCHIPHGNKVQLSQMNNNLSLRMSSYHWTSYGFFKWTNLYALHWILNMYRRIIFHPLLTLFCMYIVYADDCHFHQSNEWYSIHYFRLMALFPNQS